MTTLFLDLTGSYAIDQGYDWAIEIHYPGNVTNRSYQGVLRDTYSGTLLAQFQTGRIYYDDIRKKTVIPIQLSASQTKKLNPTGSGFVLYAVRVTGLGITPFLLLQGKVKINPVTAI